MNESFSIEGTNGIEELGITSVQNLHQGIKQLSEFISGLTLDQSINNQLVVMIVNQVVQAEVTGFSIGFMTANHNPPNMG